MTDEPEEEKPKGKGKHLYLPGNKFWTHRKTHGVKKIFETPDDLYAACLAYFDWCDENPVYIQKAFGTGLVVNLPHARAMTIAGLCVHAGINRRTWDLYRSRAEFREVCESAEDIMFDQKFAGAAAGIFNAGIIARDLGLAEKKQIEGDLTIEVIDSFDDEDQDS